MKVVHLISGGDVGGAKTYIETLLPALNQNSIDASLVCVMEGAMTDECRRLGIKVTVFPQRGRWDLSVIKKMAGWCSSEGFDIIHCHGARANFIAFFLRFYVKTPMLTTLHSDYMLDFKGSGYRHFIYTPLNVLSLKRFRHFITISNEFKKMLIERGFNASQIDVIYNGIDFVQAAQVTPKDEFLASYNLTSLGDIPIIGCAARLHPAKGVDILLKAAKELFKKNNDAILLIAGDGSERKALTEFIEENGLSGRVKLLGFVKDISSFYAAIDINVVPSISEGFSLTLIEGARFALNTIASDTGGIPEVVKNGETGILFPTGDWKALSDILMKELKDPSEGMKRGERFKRDAAERFSSQRMALHHIEAYKNILKEKSQ